MMYTRCRVLFGHLRMPDGDLQRCRGIEVIQRGRTLRFSWLAAKHMHLRTCAIGNLIGGRVSGSMESSSDKKPWLSFWTPWLEKAFQTRSIVEHGLKSAGGRGAVGLGELMN